MDFSICKKTNTLIMVITCHDKKVNFRVNTPFSKDIDIQKELQGLYEKYKFVETEHMDIKESVLTQLQRYNGTIEIGFDKDFDECIRERIYCKRIM